MIWTSTLRIKNWRMAAPGETECSLSQPYFSCYRKSIWPRSHWSGNPEASPIPKPCPPQTLVQNFQECSNLELATLARPGTNYFSLKSQNRTGMGPAPLHSLEYCRSLGTGTEGLLCLKLQLFILSFSDFKLPTGGGGYISHFPANLGLFSYKYPKISWLFY